MRRWAGRQAGRPEVRRIGYFGSYARGDWGVGSDVDIVAVVSDTARVGEFETRARGWDTSDLPVAADLIVYTESEWNEIRRTGGRFGRVMNAEVVWVLRR